MALFRGDVELGKKDDEYKPRTGRAWRPRNLSQLPQPPSRRSVRRLAFILVAVLALCYFLKGMLDESADYDAQDLQPAKNLLRGKDANSLAPPARPTTPATSTSVERSFNGPIKFYELAATLHVAQRRGGGSPYNMNVLFAAASLRSAAILLPIACEMAILDRSVVHFAFLGRDDISMDLLQSVNGVNKDCKIMFHDARPDFAQESTEFRMEVSCSAAYNHINTYVHPQATIVDGSGFEERYFMVGVKDRANSLGNTVIDLPENVEQNMMWITLMDSHSLAAWNKVTFDILIHAQPSASGSLIRLLESLKHADYFSSAIPRLTIELPHDVDEPTVAYLRDRFRWPPYPMQNGVSLLTLHRRVANRNLSPEENSIRFLEAFWPANPEFSHVLVLSPQTEVSPLYFHYLKYAMLEWKHSTRVYDATKTLGISLELPRTYLNGTMAFKPPKVGKSSKPFLWQAPNSNAMLYFGERWAEIHDFISKSLASQQKDGSTNKKEVSHVSKVHPSWLSYMLDISRVRGYSTIYPYFKDDKLVTLHTDLFKLPEEHKPSAEAKQTGDLGADVKAYIKQQKEQKLVKSGFLGFVKDGGSLPLLSEVPTITFDGHIIDWVEMERRTDAFVKEFREGPGKCGVKQKPPPIKPGKANDLFCFDQADEAVK